LSKSQQALQALRLELVQVQSQLDASEAEKQRIETRYLEDTSQITAEIDALKNQMESNVKLSQSRIQNLEKELSVAQVELESCMKHLDNKSTSLIQLEQHNSVTVMRLENKLSNQVCVYSSLS
jgi:chromosome segregation ATPase